MEKKVKQYMLHLFLFDSMFGAYLKSNCAN